MLRDILLTNDSNSRILVDAFSIAAIRDSRTFTTLVITGMGGDGTIIVKEKFDDVVAMKQRVTGGSTLDPKSEDAGTGIFRPSR